jgi:hypothetical protein
VLEEIEEKKLKKEINLQETKAKRVAQEVCQERNITDHNL